jgi:uncharacterized protein (TIGR03435 family)
MAFAAIASAQAPDTAKKAEFEVASIRSAQDDGHHNSNSDKGLLRIHNLTLKRLISQAWQVDIGQVYGGPAWIDSESYDIGAKIPAQFAQQTAEKLPEMIQTLLADRFQLVIHREPREVSGYALVVGNKGAKMEQAPVDKKDSGINQHNTNLKAENVTMDSFARTLSRNSEVGALVVDRTGLTGGFNFELDWKPEQLKATAEAADDDRPSMFTALQEKLGLKLMAGKVPVLAVVVDRAEKPEGN